MRNVSLVPKGGHLRMFDLAKMDSGLSQLLNKNMRGWV
jgi:hypothetical protein